MPDSPYDALYEPARPRDRVHSIASRIGIAPDLADDYLKVTQVESGHNVNVRDSSKGAKGFGQVMPDRPGATTRTINGRRYNLKNPDENIEAGLKLFQAGGNDPVARRLEYFGGASARRRYERTGKIPNISDGNMTAVQYVRATQGDQQKRNPYDALYDASEQTPPSSQSQTTRTELQSPAQLQEPSAPLDPLLHRLGRLGDRRARARTQTQPVQGSSNLGELRRRDEPEVKRILTQQHSLPNRILDTLGKPSSAYDPRTALRHLLTDTSTPGQRQAEAERQRRVSQASTGEYLAQVPKSAALGLASTAETGLKSIAVAAKKLNLFGEYDNKRTTDLATYQAGEWIARNARQILQSNPDLEQDFIVGQAPQAVGQAAAFLLGGVATKSPRLATVILGGGMSAGDAYDEVRANGGTDDEAINAGLLSGAILGPTELIGTRRLMKALSGTGTEQRLRSALAQALRDGSRDAVENALQEAGQEYAQGKITGVPRDAEELLRAAALGTIASGVTTTAASGVRGLMRQPGAGDERTPIVSETIPETETSSASREIVAAPLETETRPELYPGERARRAELEQYLNKPDAETAVRLRGEDAQEASVTATPEQGVPRMVGTELEGSSRGPQGAAALSGRGEASQGRVGKTARVEDFLNESQVQTKSPVETQREAVKSTPGTPSTVTEPPLDAIYGREDIGGDVPSESAPARFYHRDFGEVVESLNQRRVGKGRVRVVAEDGTEHVIKRAAMTGRGNERAVPVRQSDPEPSPSKSIWEMNPKELERARETELASEREMLTLYFGKDAQRFVDLNHQRLRGVRGAEEAQNELLARLTPKQEKAIDDWYRESERRPSPEDYRRYQRDLDDIAGMSGSEEAMAEIMARILPKISRGESGHMSGEQRSAYSQLKYAAQVAREAGLDPQRLEQLTKKTAGRLYGEDAEFMLREFLGIREQATSQSRRSPLSERSLLTESSGRVEKVPVRESAGLTESVIEKVRPSATTEKQETLPARGLTESPVPEVSPLESTTSARKVQLAEDRAELDLPELPPTERKSWQRSLAEAKPDQAQRLADEVLNRPRALNDSETASIVVRAQQVKNEHAQKLREISEAKDDTVIQSRRAELETLEREFDQLTQAAKLSGTEKGRALAAQKLTINQDFDLVSMVARFKAAAGREPTVKERAQIEQLARRNTELEAQLAAANDKLAMRGIEKEIERHRKRSVRAATKAQLDTEWADLTKQFAEIRQREASFFKSEEGTLDLERLRGIYRRFKGLPTDPVPERVSLLARRYGEMTSEISRINLKIGDAYGPVPLPKNEIDVLRQRHRELLARITRTEQAIRDQGYKVNLLGEVAKPNEPFPSVLKYDKSFMEKVKYFLKGEEGEFDPEAVKLIGKMVRNRVQAGVVSASQLVDDIHAITGGDKRELRDVISGYRTQPAKQQSQIQQQLNALKSELRQISKTEDIATGTRSPKQEGPAPHFRRDQARRTQIEKQIADLEQQMQSGEFKDRAPREPPRYTAETHRLQKQLDDVRMEYERMRYRASTPRGVRAFHEGVKAINSVKTLKSIGDVSAVFRQGGFYAITHPKEGLLKPTKAMIESFTALGYRNVEAAIKADPAYETLQRAGVEFTGVDAKHPHLSLREEGYLGGEYLDYIPGLKQVKDFSERTFVSFLDAQRLSMGKQMLDALTPAQRANPKELKAIAKLINAGTGRGNLGARGNSAAPVLNVAFFSPRLLASRVQLLNNMISPRKLATMPPGARKQMIMDNVKFVGATMAILGLAKAAGMGVNLDPDDADFLKIRAGNTTYDTLTGLQQPLRYFINMGRAIKADLTGDETYAGQSKGELTGRFVRSKLSPSAGTALDYTLDEDFMGRKFSATRAAKELALPLPAKDVIEAFQREGLWGSAKSTPTFAGIGVGNYPPPAERSTTHAEKLARRMVIRRLPDEARTQEEIDVDTKRSELRARSRRGEDVTSEVQALGTKITDRQAKAILAARNRTRLEEDVNRLGLKDALLVYSVASPQQRAEIKRIMDRKANLVSALPPDEQEKIRQRMNELGITGGRVRISRPSRESRESRANR